MSGGTGEAPAEAEAGFDPESLVQALDIARQCAELKKQKEAEREEGERRGGGRRGEERGEERGLKGGEGERKGEGERRKGEGERRKGEGERKRQKQGEKGKIGDRRNECPPQTCLKASIFGKDWWSHVQPCRRPPQLVQVLLSSDFAAAENSAAERTWEEALKLRHLLSLAAKPDFMPPPCFQQATRDGDAMETCVACLLHTPHGQLMQPARMLELLDSPDAGPLLQYLSWLEEALKEIAAGSSSSGRTVLVPQRARGALKSWPAERSLLHQSAAALWEAIMVQGPQHLRPGAVETRKLRLLEAQRPQLRAAVELRQQLPNLERDKGLRTFRAAMAAQTELRKQKRRMQASTSRGRHPVSNRSNDSRGATTAGYVLEQQCVGAARAGVLSPNPSPSPLRIRFHDIFKKLKQSDPITLRVGPNEVSSASMTRLVKNHRKWVAKILLLLLDLAGYQDTVTWDGFIYVTMQFCSLSKLELCQVMFYIVSKEMRSWTVHYVTSSQLEEFYDDYYTCPVAAFNTNSIDFAKLPLAKYRMQDYIELCYRFSQLINPCMHLQRSLQQSLAGLRFWSNVDRASVYNRSWVSGKIPLDFFRVLKVTSILELMQRQAGTVLGPIQSHRVGTRENFTTSIGQVKTGYKDWMAFDDIENFKSSVLKAMDTVRPIKCGILPLPTLGVHRPAKEKLKREIKLPHWMYRTLEQNQAAWERSRAGGTDEDDPRLVRYLLVGLLVGLCVGTKLGSVLVTASGSGG
eukprot:Skav216210  [mRNA]  locus=scaffold238:169109:196968:- [translate_table: standard]